VARTKEFDPDVALRAALDLFWRQGYEATSMQDLVDHLNIGRASIYATFGTKNELYLRALTRYRDELGGRYRTLFDGAGSALSAVRELIESTAREALTDPDRKGCFMINTAIERVPRDEGARRLVERGLDGLQATIADALTRAQEQGELGPYKDPQALARFLVTFLQGIRVMAHCPEENRLTDAVDQALSVLD
jgi:TetR/AcrR family transcriptional repressor of nem operon